MTGPTGEGVIVNHYQISYRDIPAHADEAKKGKAVAVTLGSFRGTLYRCIVNQEIQERSGQRNTWHFVGDLLLMIFTLLVAKRLILLAYYHGESLQSYQAIQFDRNASDWVVWFNRADIGKEKKEPE